MSEHAYLEILTLAFFEAIFGFQLPYLLGVDGTVASRRRASGSIRCETVRAGYSVLHRPVFGRVKEAFILRYKHV